MPSLRQRMTTYLRQLSFVHEPRGDESPRLNIAKIHHNHQHHHNHQPSSGGSSSTTRYGGRPTATASSGSGCFVTQYLEGRLLADKSSGGTSGGIHPIGSSGGDNDPATAIQHGKEPADLPELLLLPAATSDTVPAPVTAACTGPDDGLTGVRRSRLHLSAGPEIDFIDTAHDADDALTVRPSTPPSKPRGSVVGYRRPPKTAVMTSDSNANRTTTTVATTTAAAAATVTKATTVTTTAVPASVTSGVPGVKASPKSVTINIVVNTVRTSVAAPNTDANPTTNNNTNEPLTDAVVDGDQSTTGGGANTTTTTTSTMTASSGGGGVGDTTADNATQPVFAAVPNWRLENDHAYGLSVSLYEQNYVTSERVGDPIADCYGLVVRGQSAVMAMADGVNWGDGARLAARSAIQGCLEYLDTAIFAGSVASRARITTRDVFVSLLRSFWEAHSCILDVGGALSTLTACCVLPLAGGTADDGSGGQRFVVCACNVGDSFGYVYSKQHGVREFTQGSHDIATMRDMRDALGALGPVQGTQPELGNLTLSMTIVQPGDIVFLTSDGISDNFDPVVGKFAEAASQGQPQQPKEHVPPPPQQLAPKRQNRSTSAIQGMMHETARRPSTAQPQTKHQRQHTLVTQRSEPNAQRSHHHHHLQPSTNRPSSASTAAAILSPQRSSHGVTFSSSPPPPAPSSGSSTTSSSSFSRPKFMRSHTVIEPRSASARKMSARLPQVSAAQRHALTLLRLEDLLCYGINGTRHPCPSARKLCHLLVDFARMITAARRGMLEQRDLYYRSVVDPVTRERSEVALNRLQQRAARKRCVDGAMFAQLPGKLDHASVVAFTVERMTDGVAGGRTAALAVETDF